METNDRETSSQDLEEKNASIPPSEAGMPSEQDAADDLPGVPEEAEQQRLERGDE